MKKYAVEHVSRRDLHRSFLFGDDRLCQWGAEIASEEMRNSVAVSIRGIYRVWNSPWLPSRKRLHLAKVPPGRPDLQCRSSRMLQDMACEFQLDRCEASRSRRIEVALLQSLVL